MPLKAVIASLEDAPESVRDMYQAGSKDAGTEGKFVLSVEGVDGFALENVTGLRSALGKERTRAEAAERLATKFGDLDPDAARAAMARVVELEAIDPAKEADKLAATKVEAATRAMTAKHAAEIEAATGQVGKLSGLVDTLARRQGAIAAIAEAKGSVDLLLPHVLSVTKAEIGDDGVTVKVLDASGAERFNSKGEGMTVAELVAEMRENDTFARAFDGEGHSGTGKKPDSPPGGGKKADIAGGRAERTAYFAKKLGLPAH